ncbi:MAG TPA: hypothetical protein VH682_09810 [Gemmataceae bacterium]|jgi:hypothetical protein
MSRAMNGLMVFGMSMIGFLIGAVILQAACVLYNKLAGVEGAWHDLAADDAGPTDSKTTDWAGGVPKLSLGYALSIVCITAIVNAVVGFLIGRGLRGARPAVGGGLWSVSPLAFLIALPANLLVMGAMLPTRFGKGLLVALLYLLLWLVLVLVLVAAVFAVALVLRGVLKTA